MTAPYEFFRQCSHVAPDSCRYCSGDAADDRERRRMTDADRARVAAEQERMAPLVAAAWAMTADECRAEMDRRLVAEYGQIGASA